MTDKPKPLTDEEIEQVRNGAGLGRGPRWVATVDQLRANLDAADPPDAPEL